MSRTAAPLPQGTLPFSATPRRALPALALSCLTAALAAGCLDGDMTHEAIDGDEPLTQVAVADPAVTALPPKPAPARFATATGASLDRFVDAALGKDASDVFLTVVGYALAPPACPVVERRGSVLWSTPDCTDASGVHHSGRLVSHGWDEDRPMVIELQRWRADAPGTGNDIVYDGTVRVHQDGQIDASLTVNAAGVTSSTFASWRPSRDDVTADRGSYVIVRDVGIAEIGGAWKTARGQEPSGAMFLDGADELMLDLDNAEPACAPILVDGEIISKRCNLPDLIEHLAAFELL